MTTAWAFSRKIALRYLWSRRAEAFISIITRMSVVGVAIGVMVLNIVMAVMTGFEHELREKIVGTDSHIVLRSALGGGIGGWRELSQKVKGVSGVISVSPFTNNQALIRSESRASGLLVRGVEQDTDSMDRLAKFVKDRSTLSALFNPPAVTVSLATGEESEARLPAILVGKSLALSHQLFTGNPISLLSPQVSSTPFGLVPSFRRFVVVGTYSSGLSQYESGVAYVALSEAQRFFGLGDTVSGLEVRVSDINAAPQVGARILDVLGPGSGIAAEDWTETNRSLWSAIQLEKRAYFVVLLLIIVMASFSIVTTLIMTVMEKRKDIAIMKTMGASTSAISRIFRIQGAVIGGVGTLLGLLLGYLGCLGLRRYGFPLDEQVFQMSTLPVQIEPMNFVATGIAAFAICFFATVYPARRAANVEPSEGLRYD